MKKFWKKAIPVALSVAVAAGLAVNAGAAFEDYMDVKGHWAEATLHQAYDDGILKGYDAYNMAPDHSITTAQAVTVLCRVLHVEGQGDTSAFDIPAGAWYAEDVAKAVYAGLLDESAVGTLDQPISRGQAFQLFGRAFQMTAADPDYTVLDQFPDTGYLTGEIRQAAASLVEAGVVNGSEGRLQADRFIGLRGLGMVGDVLCGALRTHLRGVERRAAGARDAEGACGFTRTIEPFDVGAPPRIHGKTAVAMFAMFAAAKNGRQAAIMAPTEILAAQHNATLCRVFGEDEVAFLKGGMKKAQREAEKARIASGEAKYIVGTHALLQGDVEFYDLGMVITDEQHRFGVGQRAVIGAKGKQADVLIMSATPIPRTLSLILYGDLSVSNLDELPPGRKPVLTRLVPEHKREDMYRFIEEQAKAGYQAYVVCPLVESSDSLEGVQSAEELYQELKDAMDVSVGLLHGQMSPAQKEKAAAAFRCGETKVLVATTVIEVGVDVPNATIMAIENADRFGLAQLHQLRGRVGRGSERSYCFLLSQSGGEAAEERLRTLVKTGSGFDIAEKDLEMRGPGEFLGKRQHGLNEFAAASLALDVDALQAAQKAADTILSSPENMLKASQLMDRAREKLALMDGEIARN